MRMKKLEKYNFPDDLKTMNNHQMELLATEIREFLIDHEIGRAHV